MVEVWTRRKQLYSLSVVSDKTKTRTILSSSFIRRPSAGDSYDRSTDGPFDASDFEDVVWEELARPVVIRRMPAGIKNVDTSYGFEKALPDEETVRAIVHNITHRDAKLLDSGYANIGDFELRFKKDVIINATDVVYDPLLRHTYDLVEMTYNSYVKTNHLWRKFVGKVQ